MIKLESEHRLDPIRHIGPQPTATVSLDTNGVFQDACAGKRAVTLNVDTAEGQELARRLIATADVVTANYTPDRLDRWGFDRHTLQALRPGLIVANLAVMGLSGPDAGWRSYGNGLVAMSGIAAHTGFDGRVPQCLGTMHTDFTVPYFAALQILAALHHRDRTGEGCYLEMSQYESSVRLLDVELADVLNGGEAPAASPTARRGATRTGCSRPPATIAGSPSPAAMTPSGPRWPPCIGGAPTAEAVAAWTSTRTREAVVAALRAAGVPVSAVEDLADHQTSPTTRAVWARFDLPSGVSALSLQQPFTWDGDRLPLRRAPLWMEHTYDVLVDELGLDPGRFAELVDEKVLW